MDVLPKWERLFYWVAGVGTFAYSQWEFYRACQEYKPYMRFTKGLYLIGDKRDALDYEWGSFKFYVLTIVSLAAVHLVLSQIFVRLKLNENVFKSFLLLYDTLAFAYILGTRVTLLFLFEAFLMFAVGSLQNYISTVWLLGIVFTSSLNYDWFEKWLVWSSDHQHQMFFISNAYLHIRLMSSAIEMIKQRKSQEDIVNDIKSTLQERSNSNSNNKNSTNPNKPDNAKKGNVSHLVSQQSDKEPSLLDFMSYGMYFPTALYGPIVTFDEFHPQRKIFYQSGGRTAGLKSISLLVLRIVFWLTAIELASHFMYPNSVALDMRIVSSMSIGRIIGFLLWQSLYFTMKYVCLFGIGSVACEIDGLSHPSLPRCAILMYRFPDVWKYFDVGYYTFIKKYIYVPIGGSQFGFLWKCISSVTAFAFIFYWHGGTFDLFLWSAGNWSVIAVEMTAIHFLKSKRGSYLTSMLSPAARLRMKALLYVPLYIVSAIQIACFFFSKTIAYYIADIMVLSASWPGLLLEVAGFYFNFHNAMYITDYLMTRKGKLD